MDQPANISFDDVLAHASWARQLASALVADAASAEDLVQDTWVAALRAKPEGTLSTRSWLSRVMRNLARDRWRRAERREAREIAAAKHEATASSADLAAELEMQRALITALSEIDESLRTALIRRFFHGSSTSDIALADGISERTVRDRIDRGLAALRSKLDRKFGDRTTWAAMIVPWVGPGAASTAAPLMAATVPAGWLTLGTLSKAAAALVLSIAIVAWIAAHESARREQVADPVMRSDVAFDSASPRKEESTPQPNRSDSTRSSIAIPTPAVATTLTVRVVKVHTADPIDGIQVQVWKVRSGASFADASSYGAGDAECASGVTDSAGEIDLTVPSGVILRVLQLGKGDQYAINGGDAPIMDGHLKVQPLSAGEHRSITMEAFYAREFTYWAKLVSDEDGHPIPNGIARAMEFGDIQAGEDWQQGPGSHIVSGDGEGFIELHMTYGQRFMLRFLVATPEFGPALFKPKNGHDRREDAEVLKLSRSASLEGRVIDMRGSGQANLSVQLKAESYWLRAAEGSSDGMYGYTLSWRAPCDASGKFSFPIVPSRAHYEVDIRDGRRVVLTMPQGAPDSLTLKPAETKVVEWKIGGGTLLSGIALDKNSQPVRDHEIWLLRLAIDGTMNPGPTCVLRSDDEDRVVSRAKTDEQGRFQFSSVEPGRWWVGIAPVITSGGVKRQSDVTPLAVNIEIEAGAKTVNTTIQPSSTLYVRGIVLKPDGSPMGKAQVQMGRIGSYLMERAESDPNGAFEIGPLESGTWRLRASAWGQHADSSNVDVEAGTSNVVLRLRPSGSLSVEIQGLPLEKTEIVELSLSVQGGEHRASTSGASNRFHFEGLAPNTYIVSARTSGGRVGEAVGIVIKAGEETHGVVVGLVQGGTITARYRGKDESCGLWIMRNDTTIAWESVKSGSWKKFTVPPGTLKIRRITNHGNVDQEVLVRAGMDTELGLDDL